MSLHVLIIEDRSGQEPTRAYGPYKFPELAVAERAEWAKAHGYPARVLREERNAESLESARYLAVILPVDAPEELWAR